MKPDIFDDIVKYVPEVHRQAYWRMVAHFRQLKPDDEILNIIFAMGILTFLLRDLPSALMEERKNWQAQFDVFRSETRKMIEGGTRQMVTVANHVEEVKKAVEKGSVQFRDGAALIENASREAVKQIDIDGMAQKLTAGVEERVLVPFKALVSKIEKNLHLLERIAEQILRLIEHLREIHMGRMIAAISAVIFVLCGGAFLAAYWHLQDTDKTALNDQLAQIEQTTTANQEAFAALAVNNIKVEVVDIMVNGEKQIGEKALRITPALDVQTETPDGKPKAGLIYFNVPPSFQDQIEHNQEEIQRILRQYPTSK
jgi:hypothetical protein